MKNKRKFKNTAQIFANAKDLSYICIVQLRKQQTKFKKIMTANKKNFKEWRKECKTVEFVNSLENVDLKIGDKVTYTNEFGVKFKNREVLGFKLPEFKEEKKYKETRIKGVYSISYETTDEREPETDSRCVFIDSSSYWFAVNPKQLTKE